MPACTYARSSPVTDVSAMLIIVPTMTSQSGYSGTYGSTMAASQITYNSTALDLCQLKHTSAKAARTEAYGTKNQQQ